MPDITRNSLPRLGEQDLLNDAREQVNDALVDESGESLRWGTSLLVAVTSLGSAYERHTHAAEGPDGALHEVTAQRPAFEHAAHVQEDEHAALQAELHGIQESLSASIEDGSLNPGSARELVAPTQDAVRRHMATANVLSFEAFNREDGGEG